MSSPDEETTVDPEPGVDKPEYKVLRFPGGYGMPGMVPLPGMFRDPELENFWNDGKVAPPAPDDERPEEG